jgi:hypothetical protein
MHKRMERRLKTLAASGRAQQLWQAQSDRHELAKDMKITVLTFFMASFKSTRCLSVRWNRSSSVAAMLAELPESCRSTGGAGALAAALPAAAAGAPTGDLPAAATGTVAAALPADAAGAAA